VIAKVRCRRNDRWAQLKRRNEKMKVKYLAVLTAGIFLAGMVGIAQAENEATFDFGTGTLNIPKVDVGSVYYNVDMQQQGQDLDFEVTLATPSTSSSTENIAIYNSSTGDLNIPTVIVGSDSYNVDMAQQRYGYNFSVTTAEPISSTGRDTTTAVVTVLSAGQVWMDRNLGASRVAASSTDSEAYGDLYQWGRGADGHEKRTSGTTTTTSSSDTPGHGNFIYTDWVTDDWRVPSNNNLWQGVSGINNPCPAGFRLPTETEFTTEMASWASNDPAGAFASPLKLVLAGFRGGNKGIIHSSGEGYYQSSVAGDDSTTAKLYFSIHGVGHASIYYGQRSGGASVRCIMDSEVEPPSCDSSNLNFCTSTSTCSEAGGFWYDSTCNNTPEPDVCDSSHLTLCISSNCSSAGGYWYNNTCNQNYSPNKVIELSITDSCDDGYRIDFRFHDVDDNLVWPSAIAENYGQKYTHSLLCTKGNKICYGAETGSQSWGVGLSGNQGCDSCCVSCEDAVTHAWNLTCDAPTTIPTTTPTTVIESQISGSSNGFDGDTIFTLTNGQFWQQTEYYYYYRYAYMPNVLIYPSGSGYNIKIDGIDRGIGVTQLTNVTESRISGSSNGFDGDTIFTLTNGQIWQQTEYYYSYHYSYSPSVLIYQSGSGYKIKVDGIDKSVGVARIN
jgi:uncharacterized protein (TIGR02145 family)